MTPMVLRNIFDLTIDEFFRRETQEVLEGVNERNNCGRMALYMQHFAEANNLHHYFADTEYNRKQDGKIKTILDGEMRSSRLIAISFCTVGARKLLLTI